MSEERAEFEKWLTTQARCLGYPECDGDLVGEEHSENCPIKEPGRAHNIRPWNIWQAAYAAGKRAGLEQAGKTVCWLCGSDNAAKYPLDPSGSFHVSDELTNGAVECIAAKLRARALPEGPEGGKR